MTMQDYYHWVAIIFITGLVIAFLALMAGVVAMVISMFQEES